MTRKEIKNMALIGCIFATTKDQFMYYYRLRTNAKMNVKGTAWDFITENKIAQKSRRYYLKHKEMKNANQN